MEIKIIYLLIILVVLALFSNSKNTEAINGNYNGNGNKDLLDIALYKASNTISNNVDETINHAINGPKVNPNASNSFKWKSTTGDEIIIAEITPNKQDVVLYLVMKDGTTWKAMETKVPYNIYFRDYIIDQNVIGKWEKLLFPNRIPNIDEYWHDFLPKYSSNYDVREGGYIGITNSDVPPTTIPKYLAYHLMDNDRNKTNKGDRVRLPNDFVNNLPDLSKPIETSGPPSQGGGVVSYMHNFKKRHVPYESLLNIDHRAGNYCNIREYGPKPAGNFINNVATSRRSIL